MILRIAGALRGQAGAALALSQTLEPLQTLQHLWPVRGGHPVLAALVHCGAQCAKCCIAQSLLPCSQGARAPASTAAGTSEQPSVSGTNTSSGSSSGSSGSTSGGGGASSSGSGEPQPSPSGAAVRPPLEAADAAPAGGLPPPLGAQWVDPSRKRSLEPRLKAPPPKPKPLPLLAALELVKVRGRPFSHPL